MRPPTTWQTVASRVSALGASRLALALGIVLVLVSLALPFWSLGSVTGTAQDISSFSWTTVTTDRYRGGAWDGTEILPYTSTQFTFRAVASVLGTAYILDIVLLVILAVVFGLLSTDYGRLIPTLSNLVISLVVLGVGLFALFYPIVAIPGAATTDIGTFTIGGFWGTWTTGPTTWSWGPGLGWWMLLAGVLLGIIGAVLPYLKAVWAMVPPAPQGWRPSS